ncbi:MAG: protein-L-isoaspartate(D-aspartate) O-methyltransferase [Saprospiraceae bacterium]|nr:protein-L-isoaspartate(D-aspartate) O-methyltransferase [Saprospiraceae bacterium]
MTDSYRHKGLRKKLVAILKEKGIEDQRILDAIGTIPRHFFLDPAFADWAYKDAAFPIGSDQTISQPYTVAYQTALLELKAKDKVLEVGTGSGYQAAVLAEMGAKVYSVERQPTLYKRTKKLLKEMGYETIRLFLKDGSEGLPRFAPFDKILVTAAADRVPSHLKEQLAVGGILVIPVGDKVQVMYRIQRTGEKTFDTQKLDLFKFVPLLKGVHDDDA